MGRILRDLRGNLSVKEVSEAVGVSESAYIKYERGERCPRDSVKIRIANFFGKTVESIFFAGVSTKEGK